ncbi:MAG TPA: pyrroline-5-carboxylate reductase [Caulobacteraceae bacterium]|jgi:pyrroline-5-carboxylate reductase|nr:pyrroline-5-carboxylate reductase [Caulobacteraceae bacterium]
MAAVPPDAVPVLLVGAGHMGGALAQGWIASGALEPRQLMIADPSPGAAARAAIEAGAVAGPSDLQLAGARTVVLAVKPQGWRAAVEALADLPAEAIVFSIMAGVAAAPIRAAFGARRVGRVMPTLAAAIGRGSASVWAPDDAVRARAMSLFSPLGTVVDLPDEAMIHVATAASGSAPAYAYALVEALQAAGVAQGLPAAAARDLARGALIGAAALLESSGAEAGTLRAQVASPGGTTEAALKVLQGDGALERLIGTAVAAAAARSRELAVP